jgi:hypothetical protein
MTKNFPALLLRVIAVPFPPQALGWAALAVVLTVTFVALAPVHSFAGVLLAALVAALGTCGLHLVVLRRQHQH